MCFCGGRTSLTIPQVLGSLRRKSSTSLAIPLKSHALTVDVISSLHDKLLQLESIQLCISVTSPDDRKK